MALVTVLYPSINTDYPSSFLLLCMSVLSFSCSNRVRSLGFYLKIFVSLGGAGGIFEQYVGPRGFAGRGCGKKKCPLLHGA